MKSRIFRSVCILIILLGLFSTEVFAQKFILLQKGNNQKSRIKFEVGEVFTYKTNKNDFYISDIIREIQTDIIVLSENILRPEDITSVYIQEKDPRNGTLKNLSFLSYGAGSIFLSANLINNLYQEGNLKVESGSIITSAALFGSGFILSKIRYRHFRLQGRNKIQLVILYGD